MTATRRRGREAHTTEGEVLEWTRRAGGLRVSVDMRPGDAYRVTVSSKGDRLEFGAADVEELAAILEQIEREIRGSSGELVGPNGGLAALTESARLAARAEGALARG